MTIEVQVRNNNVEKAIRVLKKKIQKDGLMRELRQRQYYEKPTLKRQRKLKESLRRVAKENRLREQVEKEERDPPQLSIVRPKKFQTFSMT